MSTAPTRTERDLAREVAAYLNQSAESYGRDAATFAGAHQAGQEITGNDSHYHCAFVVVRDELRKVASALASGEFSTSAAVSGRR